MTSELSHMIYDIMSNEMGELGPHIVRKQCRDIQVNPDAIRKEDLPRVARVLSEVMLSFGREEAKKIYTAINKLQNLETIVEGEADDHRKMEGFLDLGDFARFSGEYKKAWEYYEKLLELSTRNGDNGLASKANCMLGLLLNEMNEPSRAPEHFQKALELSGAAPDLQNLALIYRGLGYSNWRLGRYAESLKRYDLALEHSAKSGNDELRGIIYIDIGLVNDTQGRHDEALKSFKKAIQILKLTDNVYNLARTYNNIGEVYKNMGDLRQAIKNYDLCYKIASSVNYRRMMGYALGNSAECLARLGRVKEAGGKAKQTMDIFVKYNDRYMISGVHLTYGIIHCKERNKAEMDKSFSTAIQMLEGLNFPYEIGTNTFEYGKALKEMGYADEARSKFKKAYGIFLGLGSEKFVKAVQSELLSM
jgi:tetratricopeptide (TPR) repeat protein